MKWLEDEVRKKPELVDANQKALQAGYNAGDIHELFQGRYEVEACDELPPGTYRNIMGNQALGLGLVAGAESGLPKVFLGAYPITPASDLLHQLAVYKNFGVVTFQAEDEIAAICAALGASLRGSLGMTSTSGPGIALKARGHGAGRHGRAAARHRQRPARRPVDGHADQGRAGRPLPGHLRPQRRGSDPGRGRLVARRTLRDGDRGLPHRGQVHDPGHPALRQLHRQRLRAVAAPRPRRDPADRGRPPT